MDKRLKNVLIDIEFAKDYLDLFKKNEFATNSISLTQEQKENIFRNLNLKTSYFKKERFFQIKETNETFLSILNIAISDTRIEFILFFKDDALKFKDGGPFGMLAKRINPKIKAFHKIPYNSAQNLEENIYVGYQLYKKVEAKLLKLKE